jgi:hypothetical protein
MGEGDKRVAFSNQNLVAKGFFRRAAVPKHGCQFGIRNLV